MPTIKPITIITALYLVALLDLSAALGLAHSKIDRSQAETAHMLAQRIAVLEVESFIKSKVTMQSAIERRGYAELIVDAANEFNVPHMRVARVAVAESSLNHRAIGDSGKSIGIMQVSTRWWVGVVPFIYSNQDLKDPALNIRAVAWILRYYADQCGEDESDVLACWNGGEKPNEQARAYGKRVAGGA